MANEQNKVVDISSHLKALSGRHVTRDLVEMLLSEEQTGDKSSTLNISVEHHHYVIVNKIYVEGAAEGGYRRQAVTPAISSLLDIPEEDLVTAACGEMRRLVTVVNELTRTVRGVLDRLDEMEHRNA